MSTSNVRALIRNAEEGPSIYRGDPAPGEPREGILPGQWVPDRLGLPPGCPVTPLGVEGTVNWFLDPIGQLSAYIKPYNQADTLTLCRGRHNWLKWAWPKWGRGRDGKIPVTGWENDQAREALTAAATAMGSWSPAEQARGRGMWVTEDGALVVHTGKTVLMGKAELPPGLMFGHVYPARPKIPGPWPQPIAGHENPAKLIKTMLRSWNWARPDIDPILMLGWIGCAMLSGALPWRPAVFITGDKGTGKSTLQELVKLLLGDWLIQAVDTTGAGIYQRVGYDCLPIAVDELEGESDVRKQKAVLKLARIAASGGLMLRGGDRHQGVEFRARSCFLFSSINTPPLEPQDLSRMALLRLFRFSRDKPVPILDRSDLAKNGRFMLRRLIDQWSRFDETWAAFRAELQAGGMDARGQDTFGTLLAVADMIEHDGWDEERLSIATEDGDVRPWRELMAASGMAEFEDATENWRLCLSHMLSVPVEAWRNGTRQTVGQVIETWFKHPGEFDNDIVKVRAVLAQAGLALVRWRPKGSEERAEDWLAVPNQNAALRRLFEGSKWAGEIGASVWSGALRQAPRGDIYELADTRIAGVKARCTFIRLAGLYGPGGMMQVEEDQ